MRVHLLKVRLRAVRVSLHLEEHQVERHLHSRVLLRWRQAWGGEARWQEQEQVLPLDPLLSWRTFFRCDQRSRAFVPRRVLPKEQMMSQVQALGQDRAVRPWVPALPVRREVWVSVQGSLPRRERERSDFRVCRAWEHRLQELLRHCPAGTRAWKSTYHWVPRVWLRQQEEERKVWRERPRSKTRHFWQSAAECPHRDAKAPQKLALPWALRLRETG